jgi:drug/metabolite transporter (DMT)-like permease
MQITPEIILGTMIGLIIAFLWAFSVSVFDSQSGKIKPIAITAFKVWLAVGVTSIVVVWQLQTEAFLMPFESLLFLVVSSTIGKVVGDTLYLAGQEKIGVAYAFPIMNTFPILTYIFAIIFLGELLLPFRFLGIILAIIGISLVTNEQSRKTKIQMNSIDRLGIPLVSIATILYAISTIMLEIGVSEVNPIYANFIRMLTASVFFIPIFLSARYHGMPQPEWQVTKIILIGALAGTAIGSLLYVYAIKLVGATLVTVMTSLSPLFALAISIIFMKEGVSKKAGLGIILSILGVVFAIVGF